MSAYRRSSVLLILALFAVFLLSACGTNAAGSNGSASTIQVVAAENFYGDIVRQLGGSHVAVTSILSDPNVDPHEYESNTNNAIAVGKAKLVIENGDGYDDWMDKLISSTPNSNRIVLKGFELASNRLPDNEHVWYSPDNVETIAQKITTSLKTLDTAHADAFDKNLQTFKQALQPIDQKISEIKAKYNGTAIGLTETIFRYQTGLLGLNVLTPYEFQKAMAQGNDPPANSVVTADDQIKQHKIKVLIYNEQTVSSITTKLQNDARAQKIPVVAVTETMPSNKTYQSWMLDQLNALETSLAQ